MYITGTDQHPSTLWPYTTPRCCCQWVYYRSRSSGEFLNTLFTSLFISYLLILIGRCSWQGCSHLSTKHFWWIKGDAVDLVEGLCKSVLGEWSGDVDLHDGQLQEMFQQYQSRLQFINNIGLDERRDHSLILTSLQQEKQSPLWKTCVIMLYSRVYSNVIITF